MNALQHLSNYPIDTATEGVKVLFCLRNEKFRLPYFLDYYRNLGVKEFFAIDNNSTDDTQSYLLTQPDVHVFYTDQSYKSSNAGRDWTSALADQYCQGKWCLTLDVDEFFLYPYIEYFNLDILTAYLNQQNYEGVYSLFLDFYANGPLSTAAYTEGTSPFDICNYFDTASSYKAFECENFPYFQIKGGIRQRKFWDAAEPRSGPTMRKLPLVKWKKGFEYIFSTHSCTPIKLADFSGSIAHFKFMAHMKEFSRQEVERNDRIANSKDWKIYAESLDKEDIDFYDKALSVNYTGSQSLLDDGQITATLPMFDICSRKLHSPEFEEIRLELRQALKEKVRTPFSPYSEFIHMWPAASRITEHINTNLRQDPSIVKMENHYDALLKSRSWKVINKVRKIAHKLKLTDIRENVEDDFQNQNLHTKFQLTYGSIWWDILGIVRIPLKLLRKIKSLLRK